MRPIPVKTFLVTRSGRLAISGPDGAAWQVSMLPDTPPEVEVIGEMTRDAGGQFFAELHSRATMWPSLRAGHGCS